MVDAIAYAAAATPPLRHALRLSPTYARYYVERAGAIITP